MSDKPPDSTVIWLLGAIAMTICTGIVLAVYPYVPAFAPSM